MGTSARQQFERATWLNVLGNAFKIIAEATAGILFGSVALLADAAHSVADLVASGVVLLWGGTGYEAADADHPHGHSRFEPVTALVVGGAIALMGLLLLSRSVEGIYAGADIAFSPVMVGVLLFAIGDMGVVYWYTIRVNTDLNSTALRALAIDCKNDIYTSGAAMAGIGGVWAGYPVLDPVAGGLVSLLVIHQGARVARENLSYLLGSAPSADIQQRVRSGLLEHPDVRGIHDLVIYYEGTEIEVEVHVEVDGGMSLREAHALESALIERIRGMDGIRDAHVHLDPSGLGEWKDAQEEPADQ